MTRNSIEAQAASLAAGDCSSAELTQATFERIDNPSGEGSRTFIRLFRDRAIETARYWDRERKTGRELPPLAGIPIAVKDLFDVEGSTTTAGSVVLKDAPVASDDADIVRNLRVAGAVIVGTTNMTEFAMGVLGTNPHYGTPLNPFDRVTGRIPGGSSSGAAVAVADDMVCAAIGSDTAGSIQVPAAFCGLTGFKPTARRVSRKGAVPLAPSADSIGPIARTVQSCALLDAILSGDDVTPRQEIAPREIRLAVPQTVVLDDLENEVAKAFEHALATLSAAGVTIVEIPLRELAEIRALTSAFGLSVVEGFAWHKDLLATRRDQYHEWVASRFAGGASILASDYIRLLDSRAELIERCSVLTRGFDTIVMPTVQCVAPPVAPFLHDEKRWLDASLQLTRNPNVANFLDRCALTLPCAESSKAPVGISLVGRTMDDSHLLDIGLTVEGLLNTAK